MMVRKMGSKKEKKNGTNSQFHQHLGPDAAICMSYSENENLCSYHKNVS
jgi:hypothetical protein